VSFARPRRERASGDQGLLVVAGSVDDFANGSVTAVPAGRFYLVRLEDGGFSRCTVAARTSAAPCHGRKGRSASYALATAPPSTCAATSRARLHPAPSTCSGADRERAREGGREPPDRAIALRGGPGGALVSGEVPAPAPHVADGLRAWRLLAVASLAVIVAAPPAYLLRERLRRAAPADEGRPTFVGREKCAPCHKREIDAWRGSDHDNAMAEAAPETVRGDFGDVSFEAHGVTSRFYRKDGKYLVRTEGPGGTMADFEIAYTFGWRPLQQYLVRFRVAACRRCTSPGTPSAGSGSISTRARGSRRTTGCTGRATP